MFKSVCKEDLAMTSGNDNFAPCFVGHNQAVAPPFNVRSIPGWTVIKVCGQNLEPFGVLK